MRSATSPSTSAANTLGLWDAVSIILGIIIGTGIFVYPPDVFSNTTGPTAGLGVWVLGGVLSLVGALCYAELATTYPSAGGDYGFLTRAYGPLLGFLFAWAQLAVIRTGAGIALMAYGFATYGEKFAQSAGWDLGPRAPMVLAVLAVTGVTLVNACGLRPGKRFQNMLTLTNVLGLAGIVVAGVYWYFRSGGGPATPAPAPAADAPEPSFALALVFVFLAYGGWNEAAYVANDLRNRRRTIVLALVLGLSGITLIYLAVNAAYLSALGFEGVRQSSAVAADVLALPLGEGGKQFMSLLVMISALGAINALLFTGMRLFVAFGTEHRLFGWLGKQSEKDAVAPGALLAQFGFTMVLIALIESAGYWREPLGRLSDVLGLNFGLNGETPKSRIEAIVDCTAPVFYTFLLLTSLSVFILRVRDRHVERPFRVPGYPVVPLVFAASCLFMLYRTTDYALSKQPFEAIVVGGLLLAGLPLYALSGRAARRAGRPDYQVLVAKENSTNGTVHKDVRGGPDRPAVGGGPNGAHLGAGRPPADLPAGVRARRRRADH
jgi:amino acid transporter